MEPDHVVGQEIGHGKALQLRFRDPAHCQQSAAIGFEVVLHPTDDRGRETLRHVRSGQHLAAPVCRNTPVPRVGRSLLADEGAHRVKDFHHPRIAEHGYQPGIGNAITLVRADLYAGELCQRLAQRAVVPSLGTHRHAAFKASVVPNRRIGELAGVGRSCGKEASSQIGEYQEANLGLHDPLPCVSLVYRSDLRASFGTSFGDHREHLRRRARRRPKRAVGVATYGVGAEIAFASRDAASCTERQVPGQLAASVCVVSPASLSVFHGRARAAPVGINVCHVSSRRTGTPECQMPHHAVRGVGLACDLDVVAVRAERY